MSHNIKRPAEAGPFRKNQIYGARLKLKAADSAMLGVISTGTVELALSSWTHSPPARELLRSSMLRKTLEVSPLARAVFPNPRVNEAEFCAVPSVTTLLP